MLEANFDDEGDGYKISVVMAKPGVPSKWYVLSTWHACVNNWSILYNLFKTVTGPRPVKLCSDQYIVQFLINYICIKYIQNLFRTSKFYFHFEDCIW
jgi:hypothetical protein